MSENQSKSVDIKSNSSFVSKIKGFLSREDPNPPPKVMKLGKSGNIVFDEKKKRWLIDGEAAEEPEVLPPPKFTKSESLKSNPSAKKKLYVDILEDNLIDSSYQSADVPHTHQETKSESFQSDFINKDNPKNLFGTYDKELYSIINPEFDIIDETKSENQKLAARLEKFLKKNAKYKEKIKKAKENEKILKEFIEKLENYNNKVADDTQILDYCDEIKETMDIGALSQIEFYKQLTMKLENELFIKNKDLFVTKSKLKNLKTSHIQQISDMNTNILLENEIVNRKITEMQEDIQEKTMENHDLATQNNFLNEKILNLEESMNEKDLKISEFTNLCHQYQTTYNAIKSECEAIRTKLKEFINSNAILQTQLTKTKAELEETNKKYSESFQTVQDYKLSLLLKEHEINLLSKTLQSDIQSTCSKEISTLKNKIQIQQQTLSLYENQDYIWQELQQKIFNLLEENQKLKENHLADIEKEKCSFRIKMDRALNEIQNEKLLTKQLKAQISTIRKDTLVSESRSKEFISKLINEKNEYETFNQNCLNKLNSFLKNQENLQKTLLDKSQEIENLNLTVQDLSEQNRIYENRLNQALERCNRHESKYKVLKTDHYENLVILGDLKNEINAKDLDINRLSALENCSRCQYISDTLSQTEKNLQDSEETTRRLEAINQNLNEKLFSLSNDYETSENLKSLIESELNSKITENYNLSEKIIDLQSSISILSKENEDLNEKYKTYDEQLFELQELKATNQQNSMIHENLLNEASQLNNIIKSLVLEKDFLNSSIDQLQIENLDLKAQIEEALIEKDQIKNELDRSQAEYKQRLEQLSYSESEISTEYQSATNLQAELDLKNSEILEYKNQIESVNNELYIAKKELKEYEKKNSDVLQAHEDRIKKILEDSQFQLINQKAELIELKKKYSEKTSSKKKSSDYENPASGQDIPTEKPEIDLETIKKLQAENLKLKEKESYLKKTIEDLNTDIENLYEKNLNLQQKQQQSLNVLETQIKQKDSEINILQEKLARKKTQIKKCEQRLKEKDEELYLAKELYQTVMLSNPKPVEVLNQVIEDQSPIILAAPNTPVSGPENPNTGWLAQILSTLFLTDSEREGKLNNT